MASNNSICSCNVKNNLRSMIGYRYDSDHDFYEQLKKAIGYTGATYDGVCERLIELMDDRALELKTEALGEAHKRPEPEVFGADGVPIKVGETVYEVYDGGRAEVVKSITYVNNFCKINYESDGWGRPNILIHTSPDTQERINEDASMHPHEYCKKYGIQVGIIDDAQYTLSNFIDPMVFDLLRRQRELDARTMGGDAA